MFHWLHVYSMTGTSLNILLDLLDSLIADDNLGVVEDVELQYISNICRLDNVIIIP